MPPILVVEQDPGYANRIVAALESAGYSVTHAANREDAEQAAGSTTPTLVLANGMMPGAKELLGRFSRRSGGPGSVVLLPVTLANHASPDAYDADETLSKPFSDQDLERMVRAFGAGASTPEPTAPRPAAPKPPPAAPEPAAPEPTAPEPTAKPKPAEKPGPAAPKKRRRAADEDIDDLLNRTLSGLQLDSLTRKSKKKPEKPPTPRPETPTPATPEPAAAESAAPEPTAPEPPAPEPTTPEPAESEPARTTTHLSSTDIFGDVLAEVEAEKERQAAPQPAASEPPASEPEPPRPTASPTPPEPTPRPEPSRETAPSRPEAPPRRTADDDDIDRKLEETLSGILPSRLRRSKPRPAASEPAPTASQPPAPEPPASKPPAPEPTPTTPEPPSLPVDASEDETISVVRPVDSEPPAPQPVAPPSEAAQPEMPEPTTAQEPARERISPDILQTTHLSAADLPNFELDEETTPGSRVTPPDEAPAERQTAESQTAEPQTAEPQSGAFEISFGEEEEAQDENPWAAYDFGEENGGWSTSLGDEETAAGPPASPGAAAPESTTPEPTAPEPAAPEPPPPAPEPPAPQPPTPEAPSLEPPSAEPVSSSSFDSSSFDLEAAPTPASEPAPPEPVEETAAETTAETTAEKEAAPDVAAEAGAEPADDSFDPFADLDFGMVPDETTEAADTPDAGDATGWGTGSGWDADTGWGTIETEDLAEPAGPGPPPAQTPSGDLPDPELLSDDFSTDFSADFASEDESGTFHSLEGVMQIRGDEDEGVSGDDDGEPFGDYRLLERVAVGGMAEVWRARRRGVEGFQKTVAIKRILHHLTGSTDFITMFVDEAKLAAQLNHANIIQIYDLGKVDDDFFIAMEFVDGKDLRTILKEANYQDQPLPLGLTLMVVAAVARALDYAHRKRDFEDRDLGLVHRDVSPQNVLISYEGEIKLCDFGIAKAVAKASTTQMGALKGKLQYMSPEQAWGKEVDARSDIFSLGSVFWESLTGKKLFTGESEIGVLDAVRDCEIGSVREVEPTVPEAVERIVSKALAKEPEDRYQTAGELANDIKAVLEDLRPSPGQSDLAGYLQGLFGEEEEGEEMLPSLPATWEEGDDTAVDVEPPPSSPAASPEREGATEEDRPAEAAAPAAEPVLEEAVDTSLDVPPDDAGTEPPMAPQPAEEPRSGTFSTWMPDDEDEPSSSFVSRPVSSYVSTVEGAEEAGEATVAEVPAEEASKKGGTKWLWILLLVLLLATASVFAWLRFGGGSLPGLGGASQTPPPAAAPQGAETGGAETDGAGTGTAEPAVDVDRMVEEELERRKREMEEEFRARQEELQRRLEAVEGGTTDETSGGGDAGGEE